MAAVLDQKELVLDGRARTWFKPGQVANPKGRPLGSRHRIEEKLLADLADDWQIHGKDCIEKARRRNPTAYLAIIASLLPRKVEAEPSIKGVTRESLGLALRALEAWLIAGDLPGIESSGSGAGEPGTALQLSTVSETERVP